MNKANEILNVNAKDYLVPTWPAPSNVKAFGTTRKNGYSKVPYASFNLADHVGDDQIAVASNRRKLHEDLVLPSEPFWLNQIHSSQVICLDNLAFNANTKLIGDAAYTTKPNRIAVVLTADCLPILITNTDGTMVAAIHAGWRSLAANVVENTVAAITTNPENLLVWFGPAIGPANFVVSSDVYQIFCSNDNQAKSAFREVGIDKWQADLQELAKKRLNKLGIINIYVQSFCTYTNRRYFFSYRRNCQTGRMASLIWLADE